MRRVQRHRRTVGSHPTTSSAPHLRFVVGGLHKIILLLFFLVLVVALAMGRLGSTATNSNSATPSSSAQGVPTGSGTR